MSHGAGVHRSVELVEAWDGFEASPLLEQEILRSALIGEVALRKLFVEATKGVRKSGPKPAEGFDSELKLFTQEMELISEHCTIPGGNGEGQLRAIFEESASSWVTSELGLYTLAWKATVHNLGGSGKRASTKVEERPALLRTDDISRGLGIWSFADEEYPAWLRRNYKSDENRRLLMARRLRRGPRPSRLLASE